MTGARDNRSSPSKTAPPHGAILNALPHPVMTIDGGNALRFLNSAAETFFDGSAPVLVGQQLAGLIPIDSPLFSMIEQARATGSSFADYDLPMESPRLGIKIVNIEVSPVAESAGEIAITLFERSIAHRLHHQLQFRGAARSVSAMAAMLAHEVKNPLSGIRGAAQLLEQTIESDDKALTELICNETDRICALVDRMEVFADERPIRKEAINIHEVLDHCRRVASTGFGRHVTFIERYDPSLPPALGNRDILIQLFLNLLKNACEAVPKSSGAEVQLATSYRHGMRLAVGGSGQRMDLPLLISIQDNGPGIQEDLRANLFEPFVTTKASGSGLGLAFVAKAVADHGGVVELDSEPRRTVFRVTLPIADKAGLANESEQRAIMRHPARRDVA
ncbi:MAG: PAS domain-containing protein [Alphaproteobacteria bacterium]|jgi:two-component system nitrogen regulation sensor histidine kinase GlnL|nr:PAS domain-containing protein [Alphaproteobacteria bacterium]